MSAPPPPPPQPTEAQPSDAPPVYGSPPSNFEAQQPKNMDGQPEGGPHVMSAHDQNEGNDAAAEALVREFEAYDFGNDAEFRVSGAGRPLARERLGVAQVQGSLDGGLRQSAKALALQPWLDAMHNARRASLACTSYTSG